MWVKICATTNLEDALIAQNAGADAIGFVFAPSKRQVTSEQARDITRELSDPIDKVGVFATTDPYEVEHYIACSGLNVAQLHSAYDPEMVRLLSNEFGGKLRIIQTVPYIIDAIERATADNTFEQTLRATFTDPAIWAVLVDAAKSGASGGLGVAIDWPNASNLVRQAKKDVAKPAARVILAGGLRPDTVASALEQFPAWGVDVASGVEAVPGKKDAEKVRTFVKAARGSNRSGS